MANVLGNLVIDRINKICFFDSDTGELIWTLEPIDGSLSQERETVLLVRRENEEINTE